jgi:hypothetical protein
MVFPSNGRSQFDELWFAKFAAQLREERIIDRSRRPRQRDSQPQHQTLGRAERGTLLKSRKVVQLRLGDAGFSAYGRMEIDSKRTTDQRGDLQLRQFFESGRNGPSFRADGIHPRRGEKRPRVVSLKRFALGNAPDPLVDPTVNQLRHPARAGGRDTRHSIHTSRIRRQVSGLRRRPRGYNM